MIVVEICYATQQEQLLFSMKVPTSCTIAKAVILSGLLEKFPHLQVNQLSTGIFSKPRPLDYVLQEGDRIEIYRPLTHDPNTTRILRQHQGKNKHRDG